MSKQYGFGPFLLIPGAGQLLRAGCNVSLPPKVFETLLVLVERSPQVVSRAEITERVWPKVYVEEGSVAQNIFQLRRLLDADFSEGKPILTVPKRGYCFVSDVSIVDVEAGSNLGLAARSWPCEATPLDCSVVAGQEVEAVVAFDQTKTYAEDSLTQSSQYSVLRRPFWMLVAASFFLLVCGAFLGFSTARWSTWKQGTMPVASQDHRLVALLTMDDLSQAGQASSTPDILMRVLTRQLVLTGEFAVLHHSTGKYSGQIHPIVNDVLTPARLNELREQTGCNFVILGSYALLDGRMMLEADIVNVATRKRLDRVYAVGPQSEMLLLGNDLGDRLRQAMSANRVAEPARN